MMEPRGLKLPLPPINSMDLWSIPEPVSYVGAAGFEDRSLAVLNEALLARKRLDRVIGIKYLPFKDENRVSEFERLAAGLGISKDKCHWITYDRFNPEEFSDYDKLIRDAALHSSTLIVDVSGMSKLLIIALLQSLRRIERRVDIAYAEAAVYHPTREAFTAQLEANLEAVPEFLTTDIYKIVATTSLSSSSMQGYPQIMVAFPTFNHREVLGMVTEMTPQHMILIEGRPHSADDAWRLEAIRGLNRRLEDHILDTRVTSTFEYHETLVALEDIYQKYRFTHKLVVAPTGSKLQTFAVFLFRQMHPDIQIVYPVTTDFDTQYTEGCRGVWTISIPSMAGLVRELDSYRKQSLSELRAVIEKRLVDRDRTSL